MDQRMRGVLLLLLSSVAFATSGTFATALLGEGWSPGAAVLARVGGAALVLGALALATRRVAVAAVLRAPRTVLVYGVVAVAGVQLCFFSAVQTLSVGVALLLEYLAPVLVVAWLWLRTGRRPSARTTVGGAVALVGTVGVLDVTGDVRLDPVGVLWALGAAVGLACYFVVLGREDGDGPPLDPVAVPAVGTVVGAVALGLAGATGAMPLQATAGSATLAGAAVPVWVPVVGLVLVSTVLAYTAGAAGLARVGATAGSVLGLSEVVAAVLVAWALLGQLPSPLQLAGGALVVVGVVLAQTGARRPARAPQRSTPQLTTP